MTVLFIPIAFIIWNTENILLALNQESRVAGFAQSYVMAFLPGLYLQGLADLQRRFLNGFGKNNIPFICTAIGVGFHSLWSEIFVLRLNYGIVGTGIANLITSSLTFTMLMVYTQTQSDLKEALQLPDRRVFQDLK